MITVSKDVLERLRKTYPAGTRVELLQMDDVQAPPIGTKGTVWGVDDTGSIMVHWDNGSGLNVIYGLDRCRKHTEETTEVKARYTDFRTGEKQIIPAIKMSL